MPNITLYLNDKLYNTFRALPEGKQKEAREQAILIIDKMIKKD